MNDIYELEEVLNAKQEALDEAKVAFENDASDEAFETMQKAMREFRAAKKALDDAQAAESASNTVTLTGPGKEEKVVSYQPGSTVKEIVASAGWRTENCKFARIVNGQAETVSGDTAVNGTWTLQVQANTNAG